METLKVCINQFQGNLIRSIALIYAITILISCDKEAPKLDPTKIILGKWELTHYGNGNNLISNDTPYVYSEYLLDSVLQYYHYEEGIFTHQKYWFKDSLLFIGFESYDYINNEIDIHKFPYKYEFITLDSLRLDIQIPAQWSTSIYKRID